MANCTTTIDCSNLLADLDARLTRNDRVDTLLADLHYGILAELELLLNGLLEQVGNIVEDHMNGTRSSIGHNSSPEPLNSTPPLREGVVLSSQVVTGKSCAL